MTATLSSTFEQLRKGDTFATEGRTVIAADVAAFGKQTGDRNPTHVEGDRADSGVFGEPVAHGMLVLSYAFGLVHLETEHQVVLRGITDVVFTRPVKVGDTISVTGRITGLAPLDADTGMVTLTLTTANQHRRTVCRARIQMLWTRRPSARKPIEKAGR